MELLQPLRHALPCHLIVRQSQSLFIFPSCFGQDNDVGNAKNQLQRDEKNSKDSSTDQKCLKKKPKTYFSPNQYEPLLYQPESLDQDQIKQWNVYRAKLEASGEVHQTISPHSQNNCGMEALKFQVFDPNTREQAPGLLLNLTSHLGAVKYNSKSLVRSAMALSIAVETAVMHRNGLKGDDVAGFSCKPHLNDTDEQVRYTS